MNNKEFRFEDELVNTDGGDLNKQTTYLTKLLITHSGGRIKEEQVSILLLGFSVIMIIIFFLVILFGINQTNDLTPEEIKFLEDEAYAA